MPTYVVKQGESIATIARATGLNADALYGHPDNAELKKKRPNPNILHPGDKLALPDREVKQEAVPSGANHRFQVELPRLEVRIVLLDAEGKAIAGEPYVLEAGGERLEGETTGDGEVKQPIRGGAQSATLTIRGRALTLDCSCINPMTDVADDGASGARERLRNLGYNVGDAADGLDPGTRTAIALFQHDAEIEVTGKLDDATRSALVKAHRC